MSYQDNTYIIPEGLWFKGILSDIKKSSRSLQPIFEAFTNSLEAIKIREEVESEDYKGEIYIRINAANTTDEDSTEFRSLTISDNGIGFNEKEFKRFNTYKDYTKGFKNLGSGRIQFVHYFGSSTFRSIFKENEQYYEREFIVSKTDRFIEQNAIVLHVKCCKSENDAIGTEVTFDGLLETNSNIYNTLNDIELKKALIERYIHYFCHNSSKLPKISIAFYVQGSLKHESTISENDFPKIDKTEPIELPYSQISSDGKAISKLDEKETFVLESFKVDSQFLKSNDLKLVSKGEVVEDSEIKLQNISATDNIEGHKYLFLLSGNYIDQRDTNIRGELNIKSKESLSNPDLFSNKEIYIEDIQEEVNQTINRLYPEIEKKQKEHTEELEKLKSMFCLDDATANEITISVNDNENKILEKFYEVEAKKRAKVDASIKKSFDRLDKLDTRAETYADDLKAEAMKLAKQIPLQNKNALTHYVARRKLVLELLKKILDRELEIQQSNERNFDEALLHNLLFQQGSGNSEDSDLWILNEDFIYFRGMSESRLCDIKINGQKLFKSEFEDEEERYLKSLGENRLKKRPDILLFPEEGKCIIIEFKSLDVNVSEHLTQIDMYSSLIRNYTEDDFQLTTFYGYLIGEGIEPRDVLGRVGRYEHSYHFDYLFRPSEPVKGFDGRQDGSIYTEVISYRTLLERSKKRNEIYLEKLKQNCN
ncbi:MAG: hypothetical protein LUE26_04530 [Alistipes sp.]|nr:hypothetical protein [Alistipes sp.]